MAPSARAMACIAKVQLNSHISLYQPTVDEAQFAAEQQTYNSLKQQLEKEISDQQRYHDILESVRLCRALADIGKQNAQLMQRPTVEDYQVLQSEIAQLKQRPSVEESQALQNEVAQLKQRPTVENHQALQNEVVQLKQRPTIENHQALQNEVAQLKQRPTTENHQALQNEVAQLKQRPTVEEFQALESQLAQLEQQPTVNDHLMVQRDLRDALDKVQQSTLDLHATADILVRTEEQSIDLEAVYLAGTAALQYQLEKLRDQMRSETYLRKSSGLQIARLHKASLMFKADVNVWQDVMDKEYVDEVECHKKTRRAKTNAEVERNIARQRLTAANSSIEKLQAKFETLSNQHAALIEDNHQILDELHESDDLLDEACQVITNKDKVIAALEKEKLTADAANDDLNTQVSSLRADHTALETSYQQLRQHLHDTQVKEATTATSCNTLRCQLSIANEQKNAAYRHCGKLRMTLASALQRSKARLRRTYTAFRQEERSAGDLRVKLGGAAIENKRLVKLLDQSESTKSKVQEDLLESQALLAKQSDAYASTIEGVRAELADARASAAHLRNKIDVASSTHSVLRILYCRSFSRQSLLLDIWKANSLRAQTQLHTANETVAELTEQLNATEISRSAVTLLFAAAFAKHAKQSQWHQSLVSKAHSKIRRLERKVVTCDEYEAEQDGNIRELEACKAELEEKARDQKACTDGFEIKIQELEACKAELEACKAELKEKARDQKACTDGFEIQIHELEACKTELSRNVHDLTNRKTELEGETLDSEERNSQLEESVRNLTGHGTELEIVVHELQARNTELESKALDLESSSSLTLQQATSARDELRDRLDEALLKLETYGQLSEDQAERYQSTFAEVTALCESRLRFLGFVYTHFGIEAPINSEDGFCDDFGGGIPGLQAATDQRIRSLQALSKTREFFASQTLTCLEAARTKDQQDRDHAVLELATMKHTLEDQISQAQDALRKALQKHKSDVAALGAYNQSLFERLTSATAAYDSLVEYVRRKLSASEPA